MSQDSSTSGDVEDFLFISEMKYGIKFKDEQFALKSIEKWCSANFCPLTRTRYRKRAVSIETGKQIFGRRDWKCCHGIKYSSKATAKRPFQKILYTECLINPNKIPFFKTLH